MVNPRRGKKNASRRILWKCKAREILIQSIESFFFFFNFLKMIEPFFYCRMKEKISVLQSFSSRKGPRNMHTGNEILKGDR